MPRYALHDGNGVIRNVIVADSAELAEALTGMSAIETSNKPWIGWTLHGEEWRPPRPTEGVWEWDADAQEWIDVTPKPEPDPEPDTE